MELRHCGHSMFCLSSGGVTIAIDPFNDDIGHPKPTVTPDAVVVSHEHFDHNNVTLCGGRPRVIRGLAQEGKAWAKLDERVGPVRIIGVPTYHDTEQGAARGKNTVTIYEVEGLRLVHLGDLGHVLTDEQVRAIGKVDVLMVPVGGYYTIGPAEADQVIDQLQPRVAIPMHFKTQANASWPIGTLDDYLKGKTGVKRVGSSVTITPSSLPARREIWALV
ncbi:MAG: MBL fold metallo-hydrolase [Armatimonadota bacterium]|nr:MBL fold metallo-hydrolase [Armatimonadota bacterium]MDR7519959.1 MBL fold metallo-hydrolase [Armatimonadota bacterium]MDR7548592.1 MBL fold metallo-hydrolase [Armatimonadota bacterium]